MSDWNRVVFLTNELGLELDKLQTQMINTRSVYNSLSTEVNKGMPISTSADLVTALKTPGNYQLAPGTYTGNFQALADGVSITGADLPQDRVQPGVTVSHTLAPSDILRATLTVTGSRVSFCGINIAPPKQDRAVVVVGSSSIDDPVLQPDLVLLDRVEVIANSTLGGKRGIEAHTRNFTLTNSRVVGFLYTGEQSQAFLSYNGPGPYNIFNNEIEGSGQNILFGGGNTHSIAMIPSNIRIVNNLIRKPLTWKSRTGSVANSIEFKCAKNALIEDNLIDGCWKDVQSGHMIVLTPRNQTGTNPWCVVEDVTIRNNRTVNHSDGYAVNILLEDNANPSQQTKRVVIDGNLFEDSAKGFQILKGIIDYLKITDNTLPKIKHNLITFDPAVANYTKFPFEFVRNVCLSGDYGALGPSFSPGTASLNGYTSPLSFINNVIEKTAARSIPWPIGNTLLDPGKLAPLLDSNYHYIPGGAGW